jgi:DNA repair exonuclease SbcCD nuclease subunit
MKIAIINDTHWGTRNDNAAFVEYFRKFYDDVFFPYLIENDIKTVLHLGDLIDRRKFINFVTAKAMTDIMIEPLFQNGIDMHLILGNHDTYYKNTNSINGVSQMYGNSKYDNLHIYESEPVELQLGSTKVLLVPWIAKDNYDVCIKAIEETSAQMCMGHFEIKGFEMMRGQLCDHGFDKNTFNKFDGVYSGHFHHPSEYDNIKYLGAPYEMNWSDYDGKRGFHVLDTETRELEFVPNPYKMFHKVHYDDNDMTVEDVTKLDTEQLTNAYVKVIIRSKTNPYIFDLFLDRIQSSAPADVKVVEDHMNLDVVDEEELIDEAQDTNTILNQYIDNLETGVDKNKLKKAISDLYSEAMSV